MYSQVVIRINTSFCNNSYYASGKLESYEEITFKAWTDYDGDNTPTTQLIIPKNLLTHYNKISVEYCCTTILSSWTYVVDNGETFWYPGANNSNGQGKYYEYEPSKKTDFLIVLTTHNVGGQIIATLIP